MGSKHNPNGQSQDKDRHEKIPHDEKRNHDHNKSHEKDNKRKDYFKESNKR